MKNKKLEAIKNAYGEYWEQVEIFVDEDGWIETDSLYNIKLNPIKFAPFDVDDIEFISAYRPASLKGLESNNGWILLTDRFSLPSAKGHYWFITKNGKITQNYFNPKSKEDEYRQHFLNIFTHYQPITEPKPPIY